MIGQDRASYLNNGTDAGEEPTASPVPPTINADALRDALTLKRTAEQKIKSYAEAFGLPVNVTVRLWGVERTLDARLDCHLKVFKNCQGKRLLTGASAEIGQPLWELIADAAAAYKQKGR